MTSQPGTRGSCRPWLPVRYPVMPAKPMFRKGRPTSTSAATPGCNCLNLFILPPAITAIGAHRKPGSPISSLTSICPPTIQSSSQAESPMCAIFHPFSIKIAGLISVVILAPAIFLSPKAKNYPCSEIIEADFYRLIPVKAIPSMNCFWAIKKIKISGRMLINAPAIRTVNLPPVVICCWKKASPTVNVVRCRSVGR